MLMGEYNHSIDAKGRVIIPAKFREQLGDEFVITRGLDKCLCVYPKEEWQRTEDKIKALPQTDPNVRSFVRFFVSGANYVETDKQGRIVLPSVLRDYAKLTKDIVLAGVGIRAEIWDKDMWVQNTSFEDMNEIAARMAELGI